jgi:hypothetical protein
LRAADLMSDAIPALSELQARVAGLASPIVDETTADQTGALVGWMAVIEGRGLYTDEEWKRSNARAALGSPAIPSDTSRLDWLQANSQGFASAIEMDHDAWLGDSNDLRAAIDEAMKRS